MPVALFTIDNFNTRRGLGDLSFYGFSATLDREAAKHLAACPMERAPRLKEILLENIRATFGTKYDEPMSFVGESVLLRSMAVPGNCACFGIDGNTRAAMERNGGDPGRDLLYSPHNIDGPLQAACLLSTWLIWLNACAAVFDLQQPFAVS